MNSLRALAALSLLSLSAAAQEAEWRDLFPERGTDGWHNPFTQETVRHLPEEA